jgi:hypothetical protein
MASGLVVTGPDLRDGSPLGTNLICYDYTGSLMPLHQPPG